ncbi:hypothetical protein AgCh_026865 [Apium graveolens]
MKRCHRPVILEPVVPTNDTEAHDVLFLVENLETFRAVFGGKAGDDVDFPKSPDVAVAEEEVAATEEVFVSLWIIKTSNNRPDSGEWRVYLFDHGGATLVWT